MKTATHHRRNFLMSACISCLILATPGIAQSASTFPQSGKPITIVVGFPAGGGIDALARILSQPLSEQLGAPVIVENRPGAGATIATNYVARANPDGHTLLLSGPGALTIWPQLRKVPYDATAFVPIALPVSMPFVLVAAPKGLPDVKAVLAEAHKKTPYPIATAGAGTANQLSAEMFGQLGGFKVQEIGYKGSAPALVDVMAGVVPIHFSDTSAYPLIDSGKLRALAVTTKRRSARLPTVPTMEEAGLKGFEVTNWTALVGPPKMPADVAAKINVAINKVLSQPGVREHIEALGMDVDAKSTPTQLTRLLQAETIRYAKVIKAAGITAG